MLHASDPTVRSLLLRGNFGLEKESLRIDGNGFLSHTLHPFSEHETHIVRDFCENQTEINTPVTNSIREAIDSLDALNQKILRTLNQLPEPEYLWPFSNPPYIRSEDDIPVAQFTGEDASKTEYREYLSNRYGRYKMTFSGIHFNFSFADDLLSADFALSSETDFNEYKNRLYITLAERAAIYGWLMVAVTAASPLLDSSFVEKNRRGHDVFNGMASVRCSELGYWNFFAPVLDYTDIHSYADRIQSYVDSGLLRFPSELYYPIRLKPAGKNDLNMLRKNGVNHIELRMFDLNPLVPSGIEEKDLLFAQLLLIWLISTPHQQSFDAKSQVQAVQNFKNAAHYDLKTVKIVLPNGEVCSVADAALKIISSMKTFFDNYSPQVTETLHFQENKFLDAENRYAWIIRRKFDDGYVQKGLALAKERQNLSI
ncbi:MAG: hypothetical protein ACI3XY_04955 [Butyricicoccaceae bacterium]